LPNVKVQIELHEYNFIKALLIMVSFVTSPPIQLVKYKPCQTGPMGSIRFDFKLEVESVRFNFKILKLQSGSTWRWQVDKADRADCVKSLDQ
jgi:hypothetical protein